MHWKHQEKLCAMCKAGYAMMLTYGMVAYVRMVAYVDVQRTAHALLNTEIFIPELHYQLWFQNNQSVVVLK